MFFATRNDLEPGLRQIEEQLELKYVPQIDYSTPEYAVYQSALDIPGLGTTESSGAFDPSYLVFRRDAPVHVNKIVQFDGRIRYTIEGDQNPHALTFWPGGWYVGKEYEGEFLMGGSLAGSRDATEEARAIYKVFSKNLTRKFKVLKSPVDGRSCRVGPEAYEALKRGVRLITESIRWSRSYDLQLPAETK